MLCEVSGGPTLERRSELSQRSKNGLSVRPISFYQDIEIFRCTGCACIETAQAPTARYLTRCAFKADKNSLKSGYIRSAALHRVVFPCQFGNRRDTFVHGAALPIAVLVRFHLVKAGIL